MTPLPELLARAAGTEPAGFDAAAVGARVVRRQRRQRAVLAAAVVLVALALVAGALALAGSSSDGAPADEPGFGPLTVEELYASPWVLTARDGEAVGDDVAVSVTFVDETQLRIDAGCPTFGDWALDAGRIRVTEVRPAHPDCEPATDPAVVGVLAAGPAAGRVAGRAGSLELRAPAGTLGFERADRIGRPAPADDLVGRWRSATEQIRFVADGRLQLGPGSGGTSCEIEGTWEKDEEEDLLLIDLPPSSSSGESGSCALLSRGEGDPYGGSSTVRIVDGDRLVLASQLYVVQLHR